MFKELQINFYYLLLSTQTHSTHQKRNSMLQNAHAKSIMYLHDTPKSTGSTQKSNETRKMHMFNLSESTVIKF